MVPQAFVASRVGWGSWRNVPGTGITLEKAEQLVCMTKARLKQEDLNLFDRERTDRDQGIFDTTMMAFLWFREEVAPMRGTQEGVERYPTRPDQ